MRNKLSVAIPLVPFLFLGSFAVAHAAPSVFAPPGTFGITGSTGFWVSSLSLLVPLGLLLMAVGASAPDKAGSIAALGAVGLATGVLAYLLTGFGLQFGGLGLSVPYDWAATWIQEWSPLDLSLGPGWGLVGLRYIPLLWKAQPGEVYQLAYIHAIAAGTAGMIPVLALAGRRRPIIAWLPAPITAGLLYPLAGNWLWGGGWLANMGNTLSLGHGFIDLAGTGPVFLIGGAVSLSLLLALGPRTELASDTLPVAIPPVHFPLFRLLGACLALAGWLAWVLAVPLQDPGTPAGLLAMNLLLAAASGALVAGFYTGFVTGETDPLLTLQGMIAALVATSVLAAFVFPWGSLLTGAFAGLLTCLGAYALERWLHVRDSTGAVASHLLGAVWGLLAAGILANGRFGQGWQGVGVKEYLGLTGQGVTGALVGRGIQPDWPQQFYAQVIGVLALLLLGYVLPAMVTNGLRRLFAQAPPAVPSGEVEGEDEDEEGAAGDSSAGEVPVTGEAEEPALEQPPVTASGEVTIPPLAAQILKSRKQTAADTDMAEPITGPDTATGDDRPTPDD
ncbi:MAG: hypothetical protein GXP41_11170 [Chloroflexi bacterium]|nr:hypothetical protein [Chloroflexota bacterium]